jgi:ribonuclease P protein component
MSMAVGRLKRRQDFLRVAGAQRKCATPSLVLQARPAPEADVAGGPRPRVGFTASRKVGGAVQRNRARRRLRAAVSRVMPAHAAPDHDYVVIARAGTLTRAFPALIGDLESALRRLGTYRDGGAPAGRGA